MPYLNVSPSSPPHSPPCLGPRQTCLTLGLCWGAAAVWHGLGLVEACPSLPSTDAHWIDPDNAALGSPSCSRIKDPEFCVICSNFEIKSIATNDTMFHLWQVLFVLWHLIEKKTQIYMFFLLAYIRYPSSSHYIRLSEHHPSTIQISPPTINRFKF